MSRGRWIAGIALGLAICSGVSAQEQPATEPAQSGEDSGDTATIEAPSIPEITVAPEQPEHQKANARPAKNANGDLIEWIGFPRDDTNAQYGMLLASILAVIVSFIGVGLLWETIKATREVGEKQSRAYVRDLGGRAIYIPSIVQNADAPLTLERIQGMQFNIRLKNVGATPAVNIFVEAKASLRTEDNKVLQNLTVKAVEESKLYALDAEPESFALNKFLARVV